MQFLYEIPAEFWSLFRSGNRDVYIEALLAINDEYQYNNYFLSKEACAQILTECAGKPPGISSGRRTRPRKRRRAHCRAGF